MDGEKKPLIGMAPGRGVRSNESCEQEGSKPRRAFLAGLVARIRSARWRICCGRASLIIDGLHVENKELRERLGALVDRDA